jgi:hypothetical protein
MGMDQKQRGFTKILLRCDKRGGDQFAGIDLEGAAGGDERV